MDIDKPVISPTKPEPTTEHQVANAIAFRYLKVPGEFTQGKTPALEAIYTIPDSDNRYAVVVSLTPDLVDLIDRSVKEVVDQINQEQTRAN